MKSYHFTQVGGGLRTLTEVVMSKLTSLVAVSLVVTGCSVATAEVAGGNDGDDGEALVTDASPIARPLLRMVDRAENEEALRAHGIYAADAARLMTHRRGADGVLGTIDDDPFQSIDEISAALTPTSRRGVLRKLEKEARAASDLDDRACVATAPRDATLAIFATPLAQTTGNDRYMPVTGLIDGAKRSIDVTMYQLSSTVIKDALRAAAARGVVVRVLLDRAQSENGPLVTTLAQAGIEAKLTSVRFTYTHQKTMTVDGEKTLVFSGNFDRASFETGRNYGTVTSDPEDVWDFADLFAADWADAPIELACTRLILSPGSSQRIVDVVDAAQNTLEMEALYASDSKILSALERAQKRGVVVRALFNDPKFNVGDASDEAKRLGNAGIPVRRLPSRFIHAKILVADGRDLFVGSENFSTNSLTKNREAGLRVSLDPTAHDLVSGTFEADWAAAVSF